jgi:hypothetical protein
VTNIDLEETEPPRPPRRSGAEHGLASLLLGVTVALLAPLTLLVNILMAVHGPRGLRMGPGEVTLAIVGFVIAIIIVLVLGVVGLLLGAIGLVAARREGQPSALPLAGLLLNLVGLFLFLIASLDAVFVLVMFHQLVRGIH